MTQTRGRERLRPTDTLRVAARGLASSRIRSALAALGIAIGIASLVAIMGLSASSRANLLAQLDRLGTNLLTVTPGKTITGEASTLPSTAPRAVAGLADVTAAASVSVLPKMVVRRTRLISIVDTGGLAVSVAGPGLASALGATVAQGHFLDTARDSIPDVVLGATAARRLGAGVGAVLEIGGGSFVVRGILAPVLLDPTIDATALIGQGSATTRLGVPATPTTIYVRVRDARLGAVRPLLAPTANPKAPSLVAVGRPSDAIAARAATESTLTTLLIGLGAVALLVSGVGIANVMIITVLERRPEIGLRRAIGATRRNIASQFLAEATLLSLIGGILGAGLGSAITIGFAMSRGWATVVPMDALLLAGGASMAVGAVAGSYPALAASRLSPTEALQK